MTTCPTCGKSNQAHYKYCLGCGSDLAVELAEGPATKKPAQQPLRSTPAAGMLVENRVGRSVEGRQPRMQPPAAAPPASSHVACASCGADNDAHHRFCSSCGGKLSRPTQTGQRAVRTRLTSLNPDGSDGTVYPLPQGTTIVGRALGGTLAHDHYLSDHHASFTPQADGVQVKDERSLNGVYRKLATDRRHPLTPGQVFRIGQELIRFEALEPIGPDEHGVEPMGGPLEGYVGRIAMVLGRNTTGTAFPVPETGLNLGRERGEVLFADDGYVSGLHCRISYEHGQVFLTDLGSSNGTFVRISGAEQFNNGEVLLLGQQLMRLST